MSEVVKFAPIDRGPDYVRGRIVDPSILAGRSIPPRQWMVESLIPKGQVVLFTGDGGLGKSLLMQQLCTAVAIGGEWLGYELEQGRAFGLFCEDDDDELWRRQGDIVAQLGATFEQLHQMRWLSGVGRDCSLMLFEGSDARGKLTKFYEQLSAFFRRTEPALVVVDTLADTFGGNELVRAQVRAFINVCLAPICRETGATVILCGHPSQAGKQSGEGFSGSTAWHNSVRARLYLSRPDDEPDSDVRVLQTKKQNYGPGTGELRLQWRHGAFRLISSTIGRDAVATRTEAEAVYLRCLALSEQRGQRVSSANNQAHYAPKLFARMPECRGIKLAQLEAAQEALFRGGAIRIIAEGRKGHESRRITFSEGFAPPDTGAQLPTEPVFGQEDGGARDS